MGRQPLLGDHDVERIDHVHDSVAEQRDPDRDELRSAVDEASGVRGVVEAVTAVSGALSTLGAQLSSTFAELEQLDGAGELKRAFEESEPCESLGSGGS